jgi:hypothetical protein
MTNESDGIGPAVGVVLRKEQGEAGGSQTVVVGSDVRRDTSKIAEGAGA